MVWYMRNFDPPSLDEEERLLLHFGAFDCRATVWINGVQVASHEGGHTPFSADITYAFGENNVLVVRAEDPSRDTTLPRGKQYWKEKSEGIFYTRTTVIWQTVWMEPVNPRRIQHRVDLNNSEQECRAPTSRDGEHWAWGRVWISLPTLTSA